MSLSRAGLYALAVGAGLIGGVGDAFLGKWKHSGAWVWVLAGFACWNVALGLFLLMLKRALLAHCVVLFLLANCLLTVAVSQYVFDEPLSRQKWVGVALAVAAIVVMELG